MVLISMGKVLLQVAFGHFLVVQATLIHLLGLPFAEFLTRRKTSLSRLKVELEDLRAIKCVAKYRRHSGSFERKMPSKNVPLNPSSNFYLLYYFYETLTKRIYFSLFLSYR